MKSSLVILLLFLSGCAKIPTKMNYPEIPDSLMEPCSELQEVSEKETKMSEFLKVINKNYESYYDCKLKVELFQKWYKETKEIYKKVTK